MRVGRAIRSLVVGLSAVVAAGLTSGANAGTVCEITQDTTHATTGTGYFTGVLSYEATSGGSGTLTVSLTNDGAAGYTGYITAFVFNIASHDSGASATLTSSSHAYMTQISGSGLQADPFGAYDAGAGLQGRFANTFNPTLGIGAGNTGVFTFQISASDAGQLTADSFVQGPENDFNFVTNFRSTGASGDRSPGTMMVPLPPALAIGMAGLGVVAVGRRLRRVRLAAT